eukprot:m.41458 g.41458  ORF g.41458 m.41458 type:complete len:437 (-) comp9766_c0_seq2:264-1574(-)
MVSVLNKSATLIPDDSGRGVASHLAEGMGHSVVSDGIRKKFSMPQPETCPLCHKPQTREHELSRKHIRRLLIDVRGMSSDNSKMVFDLEIEKERKIIIDKWKPFMEARKKKEEELLQRVEGNVLINKNYETLFDEAQKLETSNMEPTHIGTFLWRTHTEKDDVGDLEHIKKRIDFHHNLYFQRPELPIPLIPKDGLLVDCAYPQAIPTIASLLVAKHFGISDISKYDMVVSRKFLHQLFVNSSQIFADFQRIGSVVYSRDIWPFVNFNLGDFGFQFEHVCTNVETFVTKAYNLSEVKIGPFLCLVTGEVDCFMQTDERGMELKLGVLCGSRIYRYSQCFLSDIGYIVLGRCKEIDKQNRILERVDVYPVEEYFSDIDQNDWKAQIKYATHVINLIQQNVSEGVICRFERLGKHYTLVETVTGEPILTPDTIQAAMK